jgi:outer membrane lipoprotein-sorting protein
MKRKAMIVMVGGLIFCLTGVCLAKMSTQEVVNRMRQAYEQQMSGIDDLTMVTQGTGGVMAMMGESTIYQKRAKIAGKTVYKTRTEVQFMGKSLVTIFDGHYEWSVDPMSGKVKKEKRDYIPDWTRIWEVLDLSKMHYAGTDELEGEAAHVLKMDDLTEGLMKLSPKLPQTGPSQEEEWSGWAKMWINAKNWTFMRMLMVGTGTSEEGKEMTSKITWDCQDYRPVKTMLVPHKIRYKMEMEMPDMTPEEKQMMLGMMGAFMEGEMIVTKVEVNTGLSDDLFKGSQLKEGEPMFKMPQMPEGIKLPPGTEIPQP